VDVAVIQSLYRNDEVKDFVGEYGQVIVDECHHISAFTFEQVMRQVKAKYVLGLTATPTRKDGHHPIIYMQCGPVRFGMSARTMTETTPFEHKVTPHHTDFLIASELPEVTIQDVYAALVDNASRNEMIANDIVRSIQSGRCPLLLTGRTEHLRYFAARLVGTAKHILVLKGGMGKKQRRLTAEALASVPEDESRVILARGLTMRAWTRSSLRCQFPGKARYSNTSGDCIVSTTVSDSSKSTITWTTTFRCWPGCTSAG
jgi:superfamily II DNA or RNA helicase